MEASPAMSERGQKLEPQPISELSDRVRTLKEAVITEPVRQSAARQK